LCSETTNSSFGVALTIAIIALLIVAAMYVWTSWYTLRKRRQTQRTLRAFSDPIERLILQKRKSKQHYKQSDISSYFWVNGYPPETDEYERFARNNFRDWKLEICGLVEQPLRLSLGDLRALPKQTQITKHNCIQGWSGIAEWTGVSVVAVLKLCKPMPDARYLVFTSYQLGKQSVKAELTEALDKTYYEVLNMELAMHPQTILAYEMNG
jgi:methionine sulfoxide reductase catalytic subunit